MLGIRSLFERQLNPQAASTKRGYSGREFFAVAAGCWDVAAGTFGVGDTRQRMNVQAGGVFEWTVQ